MIQSEILCWKGANRAYAVYRWRHGQIWGLLLVKVLHIFYTDSQCAFISGLFRKLYVSIVKINCLSSFLCPLKVIDVMYQATLHKEVTRYKVRQTFQYEFISTLTQTQPPSKIYNIRCSVVYKKLMWSSVVGSMPWSGW